MGWGFYLVYLLVPTAIALVSAHPSILVVAVIAFIARRWIPDPYLFFKYAPRIRTLDASVRANPDNVTARRDLAVIWLAKRRPRRALPLVEEARRREPESTELRFLLGECQLRLGRYDDAVESYIAVLDREPRFRYGDAYLRAADALLALERWQDAEEGLGEYLKINRSSVEASFKLAVARRRGGDAAGEKVALDQAQSVYRDIPGFQRRRQRAWYLRATLRRWMS